MRPVAKVACLAINAIVAWGPSASAEKLFAYDLSDLGRNALGFFNECDGLIAAGELPSPECMVVELDCGGEALRATLVSVERETLGNWLISGAEVNIRSDKTSLTLRPVEMAANEALGGWIVSFDAGRRQGLAKPSREWLLEIGEETFILPTSGDNIGAVEAFLEKCRLPS